MTVGSASFFVLGPDVPTPQLSTDKMPETEATPTDLILRQVEYYMSDHSYPFDDHLRSLQREADGCVPLAELVNPAHFEACTSEIFGPFQVVTDYDDASLPLVVLRDELCGAAPHVRMLVLLQAA